MDMPPRRDGRHGYIHGWKSQSLPDRTTIMPASTLIALTDRAVIAVGGPDRIGFLQGLVTNDVTLAEQGLGVWSALLTAQGKYLHDFIILADGDRLLLDVEAGRREDLLRRLRLFRLRAKVDLTDLTGEWVVLADPAPAETAPGTVTAIDGGYVLVDPRHSGLGRRFVLRADAAAAFAPIADTGDWDRARIALGIPDGSRDLIPEKSILLDNGFDELHGVAWAKGCYVGQELTARTKYRGLVKKRLVPVAVAGPLPAPGTPILSGTAEVGEMRSGCRDVGLALIRRETLAGSSVLTCDGAELRPQVPSWLNLPPTEGVPPTNG